MKKTTFLALSLFFGFTIAQAQSTKNKQLISTYSTSDFLAQSAQADATDVSYKSTIRYDMHNTTEADRNQQNAQQYGQWVNQNPNYNAQRNAYEQQIQQYISTHQNSVQSVMTLPVVIHCVYGSAAQNITLNQCLSQIQVMNEDFARTNADANNHWTAATNTTVQFCLAQRTPANVASTGLETRQFGSSTTSWSTNDNVKHQANGGLDAWDPTRFLNIWVCNLQGGLLGYGEFPTSSVSQTFGVVIDYTCFGSNFTSYGTFAGIAAPFDRGRTVTHEFSHCFNLYHIWGDDNGACSGSDLCADTPNQADATSGCFSFPHADACASSIMFENYMDYSDDNCLNLFTANQKSRILAVLNSAPYNALQTSNGCQSPTTSNYDAAISAIGTPSGTICGLSFVPSVTLKNWGTATLTSCTIKYKIDNNTLQTYAWTGSLATNITATVTLPSMTTTAATHTFTCYSQLPNAQTDANAANDQSTSTFTCVSGGISLPYIEGFESATFPPPGGFTLNNPDAATTWASSTSHVGGAKSAYMDNFNYNASGQLDDIALPALDLTSVINPVMTFQVAYQLYTNPTATTPFSDTLRVQISTDCGVTWTTLYYKYSTNLTTTTPTFSTTLFVPTTNQWRLETISLLPYASSSSAFIRFRHTTDFENQMYLDDINIMTSTGTGENNLANTLNIFPNPSTGLFTMNVALTNQENLNVTVTNMLGQVVQEFNEGKTYGGQYSLDLNNQPNGVYFVEVVAGEEKTVQRIVINR